MLWIIIILAIIIASVFSAIFYSRECLALSMFAAIVLLPGLILGYSDVKDKTKIDVVEIEREIKSIRNDSVTEGHFFLGTGGFGSNEYYYTFVGDGRGYRRMKIDSDDVLIVEQQGEPKYVQEIETWKSFYWIGKRKNSKHYLYVPENTIIEEYVLE